MFSLMMRSASVLAIALTAASSIQARSDLEARCDQLVTYYTRYGSSRGEDTDGNRNFIRLGAEVDCRNGRYEKGIAAMEELMRRKNWSVPPRS